MRRLNPPAGAAATESAITGRATSAGAARPTGAATASTSGLRPAAHPASGLGHEPAARGLQPFDTASWEVASGEYVEQLRTALRDLVSLSNRSLREIERELAAHCCGLDVSRLLSGRFHLKMHQLLDVCRAIGVHPMELWRLAFKAPRTPSPLIERMAALVGAGTAQARLPAPGRTVEVSQLEALAGRIEALQRQVDELRRRTPGARAVTPNPPPERRS